MDENDGADEQQDGYDAVTAPAHVWIGLIAVSAVSFWAQAVITEERYVRTNSLVTLVMAELNA